MTAAERINAALASCPYPVTQKPVKGTEPVYLSFELVTTRPVSASNDLKKIISTIQVDIWSRQAISPEVYPVVRALIHGGVVVQSWGPQIYEDDTRWHHLPVTCQVAETFEATNE